MVLQAIHENCSGCGVCRLVCALENFREVNPSKAALKIEARFPDPGDYRVHVCDQCGKCAEVCPEEAIHLEDGVYVIHRDECTGCLICMDECPYGVLFEHSSEEAPIKCTLCGECVTACPREALVLVNEN